MQLKKRDEDAQHLLSISMTEPISLQKKSLIHAIAGEHVMTGDFPFELLKLKLSGKQVCGSP